MQAYILFGFILSFIFYFIIDQGQRRKPLIYKKLFFNIHHIRYHFHHWFNFLILFLLLLPCIFYYGYISGFALILGICLGAILQGLSYDDAFKFRQS
jgi:hypothetical protein